MGPEISGVQGWKDARPWEALAAMKVARKPSQVEIGIQGRLTTIGYKYSR
jgi:hypothetical protein